MPEGTITIGDAVTPLVGVRRSALLVAAPARQLNIGCESPRDFARYVWPLRCVFNVLTILLKDVRVMETATGGTDCNVTLTS